MKPVILVLFALALLSCGRHSKHSSGGKSVSRPGVGAESVVDDFSYPASNQLLYNGEVIADLSSSSAVVSSYGSVSKGTTLNVITIDGREFLVYGEDGVFATECEPSADYPDHGATNPDCEVAHAESFDRIIVCAAADKDTPIMTAQNWPGSVTAMTDDTLGMECWVNGVKMISKKIFTY